MTDSVKANNETNRLLGKMLLPGFADAGASTSFQPSATAAAAAAGAASDAMTEIRDNRSMVKQQFRMNNTRNQQLTAARPESSDSTTVPTPSTLLIPPNQEPRKAAFFPTTKPQRSPRPASPPEVTREQMPIAPSVAGTSMVPEIGAFPFLKAEADRVKNGRPTALEKENHKKIYYWQNEESQSTTSVKKDMTLNAANLQRVEDSQNSKNPCPTDSSLSGPYRKSSLVRDDDGGSDAMSTASEMGTVIEVGNRAVRMAELDAMAALIEESPNVDALTPRSTDFPPPPSRTPNRRGASNSIEDLSMPTLDSQHSRPAPALAPQNRTFESGLLTLDVEPIQEERALPIGIPTPTEMLTSALRRFGTGLSKTKASLSAPPTPRSPGVPPAPMVEDMLKSSLTPRSQNSLRPDSLTTDTGDLPASLALRSPGSSARFSLRHQRNEKKNSSKLLAPRFSPNPEGSRVLEIGTTYDSAAYQRAPVATSLPSSVPTLSTPRRLNPVSPFRLAQQCLSFDSTLDELQEVDSGTGSASSSHVLNLETYPMRQRTQYHARTGRIQESVSWDVSSTSTAFRAEPHRSIRVGGLTATASQAERNAQRLRIHSDFSPRRVPRDGCNGQTGSGDQTNVLKLRTPERFNVDVEREDALDILACLVDRGVAAWSEEPAEVRGPNDSTESASQTREALITALIENLRRTAEENAEGAEGETAAEQMDALEELLKAHSYAMEMKRAALSASSWLRSIGRGPLTSERYLPTSSGFSTVGQASGDAAKADLQSISPSSASAAISDAKLEILTLTARLHSAENELKEKMIMNQRLDAELSKCRAEIGRLRTAVAKNESTVRSIIDYDADTAGTASVDESEGKEDPSNGGAPDGSTSHDTKMFDESFQGNNSLFQDLSGSILQDEAAPLRDSQANMELGVLKTALDKANETIRLLHEKLHHETPEEERDEAPVVGLSGGNGSKMAVAKSPEKDGGEERQTINVRMLNGENFVTEWGNLTTPLPPPPDHGLRSPIIDVVLEQWTDDQGLHESLLNWMERVMTGDNLEETVPPLTLSSLDHQVRDGFVMHLLPLLLRRADIHVNVQTRAHRTTTYDLAVSVIQTRNPANFSRLVDPRSPSLLDQQEVGDDDDHSPLPHNAGVQLGEDDEVEYTHFRAASGDMDDVQPTFMGALGGALGGLLSRGRQTLAHSPARSPTSSSVALQSATQLIMPAVSSGSSQGPLGSRVELDSQPYHRVVSAPPGRIGVTFVEYRGHAMVADMAADSPLSSWVFPSDILIAVDEVPVSGMRIRDIIKILTNRKDRQRALRVISSHAMNEFTLNQSASVDEAM